ncbi:MAG: exonuclease subunit SbcD [Spartobacteria bacterium]|nr:exonuclease subunit SbcD [Spartobacteria bacterium]
MKILHTSDWHLGRSLHGRKRYDEFEAFLDWLAKTIEDEGIDVLLVAGDIFDTSTPSNRAQELYYRFLCRVANSCCRHVVVTGGNHDSPTFLNAPKELLRVLNVHVVGAMTGALEDEVIVINNDAQPEAIVCAVPYLRDRDIRTVEAGESIEDKNAKIVEGVKNHYAQVVAIAEQKRDELLKKSAINNQQSKIPIIAMGHLFTDGGKTIVGDGVRELYVGSLAHVGVDVFPPSVDYLAMGHLHVPQVIGEAQHMRYSGSPIPIGFGEATQEKQVVVVDFGSDNEKSTIKTLPVPRFQQMERIAGSLEDIQDKINTLNKAGSTAWLEIEYKDSAVVGNLRELLDEALIDSEMEILQVRNARVMARVLSRINDEETLDDLDVHDVFNRCLDSCGVPAEERDEVIQAYQEIIASINDEDRNAE